MEQTPAPSLFPDESAAAPLAADEVEAQVLDALPAPDGTAGAFAELKRRALVRFESAIIARELARARGNVSQTARSLGLHRQSLQHKLRELGMDAESFRDRDE